MPLLSRLCTSLVLLALAIVVSFAATSSARAATSAFDDDVMATSPYAYWGLGETSGASGAARDRAGTHHATYVEGTPESSLLRGVPGILGDAIQLNDESNLDGGGGQGGYVATPVGLEVWEARKPFSLNLWVKWNGYRQWRLNDRSAGLAGSYRGFPYHIGWALYVQGGAPGDGRLRFFRADGGPGLLGTALPIGTWTMVTVTYDGTTARLYQDGELTSAKQDSSYLNGFAMSIGRVDFNNALSGAYAYFKGSIDEVAVWKRALGSGEIASLSGTIPKPTLIFVPGVAGSKLKRDIPLFPDIPLWPDAIIQPTLIDDLAVEQNGEDSVKGVAAPEVQDTAFGANIYGKALDTFREWESLDVIEDFVPFPYDWRLGVEKAAVQLAATIVDRCSEGPVWVVVHSTGGLVVKRALARMRSAGIDPESCMSGGGVIFLAVPHLGAPKAIGAAINPDLFFLGVNPNVWDRFTARLADERKLATTANNWLTMWQLMPQQGNLLNRPVARQAWFDDHDDGLGDMNINREPLQWPLDTKARASQALHYPLASLGSLQVFNVFGYHGQTPGSYGPGRCDKDSLGKRRFTELAYNARLDGVTNGDETVPGWSAVWPGSGLPNEAQYGIAGVKHMAIPSHDDVLALIKLLVTRPQLTGYPSWPAGSTARLHGTVAVDEAIEPPLPGWRTSFCSPVTAVATQNGASTGIQPDGTVVEEIPEGLLSAARTDEGLAQTLVIPQDGPVPSPTYELVAFDAGKVSIWQDNPDGSEHDFVFEVSKGDRASLRSVNGDWTLSLDRGGDGDVDETLRANHPLLELSAPVTLEEGSAGTVVAGAASQVDDPLSYAWSLLSGDGLLTAAGANATYVPDDGPAKSRISATVADTYGRAITRSVDVVVVNRAPTATAGADRPGVWGRPLDFEGSVSDPSASDTAAGFATQWSYGDGEEAEGSAVSHSYANPGSYTARFTARDKDGGVGADELAVDVEKRAATLTPEGTATPVFGTHRLRARLVDDVHAPTARLAGHELRLTTSRGVFGAQTDAEGVAVFDLGLPLDAGENSFDLSLVTDALYSAPVTTVTVRVVSSLGDVEGSARYDSSAHAAFTVHSDADRLTGQLQYRSADRIRLHSEQITGFGIVSGAAWFSGVSTDGRRFLARAEPDSFSLWINGELEPGAIVDAGAIHVRSG